MLRHSGEVVTQKSYEAALPEEALRGMRLLEASLSDPNYINAKALEGFMRTFDYALNGQYNLGTQNVDADALKKLMVEERERRERLEQQKQTLQASFWLTFPPLKAILPFRDNIRLRRYNREWIKNNIH